MSRRALALVLVALACEAAPASAQTALETATALFGEYHRDLQDLDRARDLLQGTAERDPAPPVLSALARAWFLVGEFRAGNDRERLAAYERGRDVGRRAVSLAPRSEDAHVWYALNSARWAGTRGIMRAVSVLPTLKEEAATILSLNPRSVEGHTLAGGLAAELPAMLGGDRGQAERHFRAALEADPRRTGPRVELARLYIALRRYNEAQRELEQVLDETAPSDLPYWTLADVPRARALLTSLAPRPESP